MKQELDESWGEWVKTNLSRGCDPVGMAEILLQHEFSPQLVEKTLNVTVQIADKNDQNKANNPKNTDDKVPSSHLNMELKEEDITPHVAFARGKQVNTQDKAEIYIIDQFLNTQECMSLIQVIRDNLRESTTTNDEGEYANYRVSKTCDLSMIKSEFLSEINRRICATIGIHPSFAEGMQAQWYDVNGEFKPHTDYFEPNTPEFERFASKEGQRTWTFMLYLNNTREGGCTRFTELAHEFSPNAGTAVIWNNLKKDGTPNPNTQHWGMPIKNGFKVIITQWFRDKGQGTMLCKEPNEYIPAYTHDGFVKSKIPNALFAKLLEFYQSNLDNAVDERVEGFITGENEKNNAPSELVVLSEALQNETHQVIKPLVEAWIGHFVEPTFVFGIRRYLNSAALKPHRDRGITHVASCILNISQKVDKPWPLLIEDHNYRRHNVYLEPGEMVFYEGARLLHGRPDAFEGDHFANMFVHFKLTDSV